ncbi:hypothetical protein HYPSUDRAFT_850711 [Hypholoma sublateritium FD-334 SS-4]|uniref:Uncharacterized protein n=1 Tax=Hypholoma sublateritium (strain FD-334 SS-4) TaxID=945553 RepID=A0A0D2PIG4_HYPSF|nr:hypothetical protein HYPSUDRAFT_850711 [Hypholoma sublateritium FD-334 SS-4]
MHIIPVAWTAAPAPSSPHDLTRSSSHPPFQHSDTHAARHAAVNTPTYTRAFALGLRGSLFVRSPGPFAIFAVPVAMIRRHAMHLFRTALHHVFAASRLRIRILLCRAPLRRHHYCIWRRQRPINHCALYHYSSLFVRHSHPYPPILAICTLSVTIIVCATLDLASVFDSE